MTYNENDILPRTTSGRMARHRWREGATTTATNTRIAPMGLKYSNAVAPGGSRPTRVEIHSGVNPARINPINVK
jgi:hypothetical protein